MEADGKTTAQMQDEEIIQKGFQELLNDYLATKHRKKVEIITKAFDFANQAHRGVKRLSGEPYIMHPIAVAKIVCNEIGLGSTSICAALLHDVVEDTEYTVEDIENLFGKKIAQIVDGLTKISGVYFSDKESAQAENFKKLLLTMSDDIRVILIKIADRLHNMRTLGAQAQNKRYKIAGETLYLYAPLANRLGLNKIKQELENLSFKYEHPEEFQSIVDKLNETATERDKVFAEFKAPIIERLDKMGLKYNIIARVKSPYSIWNKMHTKKIPFEEIYDIMAVRIIFDPLTPEDELNECFDIYVAISKIYKPHPDRLRDWVSHPKSNGYQALHVTLMAQNGQWIEVQIRSRRMNDIAEHGFTAHWKYKEGGGSEDEGELHKWLQTIKEILDDPQPDAMDFLDTIKLNLYASEIFVFTPKGEIKTIPQGATVLDFAFMLHTEVGMNCIGAKVNRRLVPLSYKLQSGDQVEILTSKAQRINSSWLEFVTTAKAKNIIMSFAKKEKAANIAGGQKKVNEFFVKSGIKQTDANISKLCQLHQLSTCDDLYEAVGANKVILGDEDKNELKEKQSWMKYLTFSFVAGSKDKKADTLAPEPIDKKKTMMLTSNKLNKTYTISDCCKPIPGDPVLGFIDDNGIVQIHKRQCEVAMRLKSSFGNRIIAAEWDVHKDMQFPVTLEISGIDDIGVLNRITEVLSKQLSVNLIGINIGSKGGIFKGKLELMVHDSEDIKNISDALEKVSNIKSVFRD